MPSRPANWVCMAIMLAALWALAACAGPMKQQRLKPSEVPHPEIEQIVGLTTVTGENVLFDPAGGAYIDKSIRGKVKGADYRIPMAEVERVWVMRRGISAARTTALVVGVAAATLVTVAAIELINNPPTGCPIVYAWDGSQFVFNAELYGGAISRGLERPDYSELPSLRAERGAYRILLANEMEETDYTDSLELWTVDHPARSTVGADSDGQLYLMADPRPPLEARDENGRDLLPWLQASDRRVWEPPPATLPDGRLRHEIVLDFARPSDAQTARLLVRAGTSPWGIRMLSTIFELYGTAIDARMAELDRDPVQAQAVRDWGMREDLYTLKIWVEEPSGWQVRGVLAGGGTTPRVVPLDLSEVCGDRLRVRLQPPAGFWAIDSFAVDYTPPQPVPVTRSAPVSARTQAGRSVVRELRRTDSVYYQAERGESAEIVFPAPPEKPGMARTLILASRGYYRPTPRSNGTADAAALFQIFMVPDGMARFAAQQYAAWRAAAGATN